MSTVLLIHREDDGTATEIPFTWGTELSAMCKEIADYLVTLNAVPAFYRSAFGELQRQVLEMRLEVRAAEKRAQDNEELAAWYRENGIVREAIGR